MPQTKKYSLHEMLELVVRYNNTGEEKGPNKIDDVTWRKNISANLSLMYRKKRVRNKDVLKMVYSSDEDQQKHICKVNSWTASSSPNVPTFEDALRLSELLDFDIEELLVPRIYDVE